MFPPISKETIDAGYQDFSGGWNPILDIFDEVGVRFAYEVHPSEIAFDYWTTVRTLEAAGRSQTFGLNWNPSFRMLNQIGYEGPISVEWEDAGMDRLIGAPEALEFVRRLAFDPPAAAFDAAFSSK
ncbi:hypothetical protein GCM10009655_18160 [Rhodoglobus aureus]|uniref:Sugar phosphate isomerase/epimerase n=1 Tax=Rhodoglobus aureus TaxID=191497 RepID=A0ABN1VRN5_9MICO